MNGYKSYRAFYNHIVRIVIFVKMNWLAPGIVAAIGIAGYEMPAAMAVEFGSHSSYSDLSLSALVNLSYELHPLFGVSFKHELGDDVSVRVGGELDLLERAASRLNIGLLTNGPVYCGLGLNYLPAGPSDAVTPPVWGDVVAGGRLLFPTGAVGAEYRHGLGGASSVAVTFGGPI